MDHTTPAEHQAPEDIPASLTLSGAVALGTGAMIGELRIRDGIIAGRSAGGAPAGWA
ncbi:MAG: hypothetical protein M5T61_15860 [Acidimicrobiia bacterium]|nr:hypothetical protein [Acidimicrobiia bacterium]